MALIKTEQELRDSQRYHGIIFEILKSWNLEILKSWNLEILKSEIIKSHLIHLIANIKSQKQNEK